MTPLSSWLTDGKLRLSYGVNGNIPNGLYSYNGFYSLGYIYNDQPGIVETALVNPTLSWEKNYALNAGFDLQLFGRVNISFDWYKRKTKDFRRPVLVSLYDGRVICQDVVRIVAEM